MKKTLLLVLTLFSTQICATEQIPDELIFNGTIHDIRETPLSALHSQEDFKQILTSKNRCSASWRGYKAFWEVKEKLLYLLKVTEDPCHESGRDIPAEELVRIGEYPIPAHWFSGRLTSKTGREWYEKEKKENGEVLYRNYRFEIMYFLLNKGIIIEEGTEIVYF